LTSEQKHILCQIVGTLLVSDLELHDTEMRYLENLYQKLGVSPEERRLIQASINVTDDVEALAQSVSLENRTKLLEELHDAAWADGVLVDSEVRIIETVEKLLG
jgi:uncharacterized tellurite resistance protein B-like protein